jgi:uncharacterized cysteine cluster protein YcgN (CxxCxxCC family)
MGTLLHALEQHGNRPGPVQISGMSKQSHPFWQVKTLGEMSDGEWESLCDGCGRCCLVKLEDEDTGEIHTTDVSCRLFDAGTCRCIDYANRHTRVSDCIKLEPGNISDLGWLPATCAYRLVWEGKPLHDWHPLVSGRAESVHEAGISVRGQVDNEDEVPLDDLPGRITRWPGL